MISPYSARKEIVAIGQRLAKAGFIAGCDGNISVRLDDNRILVTPAGMPKGRLTVDNLVVVDMAGQRLQGNREASSELAMHLAVYRSRSDIGACVHAHPPYATAFAVAGIGLLPDILPEIVVAVGEIPIIDYAPPGTKAVPDSLSPFLSDRNAFLLRNHGLLTIGGTIETAYNRHESVEHFAKILHLARGLGSVNRIPSEDFQRLVTIREDAEKSSSVRQSISGKEKTEL